MSNCKCGASAKIMSNVVRSIGNGACKCHDVCNNPICGDPYMLGIMAPLIYDEIGVNLCTTVTVNTLISNTASVTIEAVDASNYSSSTNYTITPINGRANCYAVTLTNLNLTIAVNCYDINCNFLGTTFGVLNYLPDGTGAAQPDEETNPSSVTLELFAPYGVTYDGQPRAVLNYVGQYIANNSVQQGINLYTMVKLLNYEPVATGNTANLTVGMTLVLQSLYFAGYKVKSQGKIDIPKGSVIPPEESVCSRFVCGDLLNLRIKPLDLGAPMYEEKLKKDCEEEKPCSGGCDHTLEYEDTKCPKCVKCSKCSENNLYGDVQESLEVMDS